MSNIYRQSHQRRSGLYGDIDYDGDYNIITEKSI